jgi:hypothetical protein
MPIEHAPKTGLQHQPKFHTSLTEELTLQEGAQHLASRLQQWVTSYNLQKPIQSIPTLFNHFIREPIRKDLPISTCSLMVSEVGINTRHDLPFRVKAGY